MTREDIKRAAEQNISGYSGIDLAEILTNLGRECFCYGAEWRIASVWHNKKEKPQDGYFILAIGHNNSPFIAGPNNPEWDETVAIFNIKQWAYIKDLMPNAEDKQ